MESTIKKSVDIKEEADGSVAISYDGLLPGGGLGRLLAGIFFAFGILGSLMAIFGGNAGTGIITLLIFGPAQLALISKNKRDMRQKLIIIPGVGICFGDQQVPYKDMSNIGFQGQKMYLYTGGTEVVFARPQSEASCKLLYAKLCEYSDGLFSVDK